MHILISSKNAIQFVHANYITKNVFNCKTKHAKIKAGRERKLFQNHAMFTKLFFFN